MTKRKFYVCTLFALMISITPKALGQIVEPTEDVKDVFLDGRVMTFAERQEAPGPAYPPRALSQGIEGWVVAYYSVDEYGAVSQVEIIDSSIEGFFEKAAKDYVEGLSYSPAMMEGVPSASKVGQEIWFILEGNRQFVSRPFYRLFGDIEESIASGNVEEARELVSKVENRKSKNLTEFCVLEFLKAKVSTAEGETENAIYHFGRASTCARKVAPKELYETILRTSIIENARSARLSASLSQFHELEALYGGQLPEGDPMIEVASRIKAVIQSGQELKVKDRLRSCAWCASGNAYWWHELTRNQFRFETFSGVIKWFDVICGPQTATLKFEEGVRYQVKSGEDRCSLYVVGESSSTFVLTEY